MYFNVRVAVELVGKICLTIQKHNIFFIFVQYLLIYVIHFIVTYLLFRLKELILST